jgi:hypothetical protein
MDAGIIENTNSGEEDVSESTGTESKLDELDELCAAALKRRGRRGRPKGTCRKHPDGCRPKTFRSFSPLAHGLLFLIGITDAKLRQQCEAEIVEEALVRIARSLSKRNPRLAKRLERAGR